MKTIEKTKIGKNTSNLPYAEKQTRRYFINVGLSKFFIEPNKLIEKRVSKNETMKIIKKALKNKTFSELHVGSRNK